MPRPARFILVLCVVMSLYCAFTALAGVPIAFMGREWYMLAYEPVVLLAAVCGVLAGLGRFREAPALAMLCAGGVVGVAAVLTEPALVKNLIQGTTGGSKPVAGVNIVPWVLGRLACAAGLVALSGLTVLLRRPGLSFPLLVKGVIAGLPVLAACAAIVLPQTRGKILSLDQMVLTVLVIVGTFVFGALTCISGHCLIRAFEIGANLEEEGRTGKASGV